MKKNLDFLFENLNMRLSVKSYPSYPHYLTICSNPIPTYFPFLSQIFTKKKQKIFLLLPTVTFFSFLMLHETQQPQFTIPISYKIKPHHKSQLITSDYQRNKQSPLSLSPCFLPRIPHFTHQQQNPPSLFACADNHHHQQAPTSPIP